MSSPERYVPDTSVGIHSMSAGGALSKSLSGLIGASKRCTSVALKSLRS